ncbi:unnamed protein product [Sphenostylis stenocarpa]|uniref:Uncharacterized protein n=1 Tax=Sphenostylis stenocarpa TaxID=92480 RepID=A0AA86TLL9_9FABA|nr:unnamed protein product [Sphenostylis stenocarpa]
MVATEEAAVDGGDKCSEVGLGSVMGFESHSGGHTTGARNYLPPLRTTISLLRGMGLDSELLPQIRLDTSP